MCKNVDKITITMGKTSYSLHVDDHEAQDYVCNELFSLNKGTETD